MGAGASQVPYEAGSLQRAWEAHPKRENDQHELSQCIREFCVAHMGAPADEEEYIRSVSAMHGKIVRVLLQFRDGEGRRNEHGAHLVGAYAQIKAHGTS